jgi:5-methyltetrahydrofolate--homocysteine methyltransferase
MISAMMEVGRLFEEGEAFVPEMLIAARAMQSGLSILRPLLVEADVEPVGRVVLGTVRGDMHDIGKNLVGMMLEGAGFEIHDLGVDVSADSFVSAVEEIGNVDVVGLSALLTTTMPEMRTVVDAFKRAEIYGEVKIMIGGAPVTSEYAESIGAHGCAKDASQAVTLAKSLTSGIA